MPVTGNPGVRVTVPAPEAVGLTQGMISFWPYDWDKVTYPQLANWHRLDGVDVPDLPNMQDLFIRGETVDANVSTIAGADTHVHPLTKIDVAEDTSGTGVVTDVLAGPNVPRHIRWHVMQYRPDLGP